MMALPHSQQQQQQLQQQQQRLSPAELSTPNLTTMFPSSNCRVSPRCPNEAELGFRVLSPTRTRVAFAPVRYGARPQARGPSLLTHSDTPPIRGLVIMLTLFVGGGPEAGGGRRGLFTEKERSCPHGRRTSSMFMFFCDRSIFIYCSQYSQPSAFNT